MINNDRIVPIQKIDLLSLYGTILNLVQTEYSVLEAKTVTGEFSVTAGGTYLANQPVKTIDFADGVSSAGVLFVAAYDFAGFTIDGEALPVIGTVLPDGVTLYAADLKNGNKVTVSALTPVVAESDESDSDDDDPLGPIG